MLMSFVFRLRQLAARKRSALFLAILSLAFFAGGRELWSAAPDEQDSPEIAQLKAQSQSAFLKGDFAQAIKLDERIAQACQTCPAHRYAVQMLGTLYEDRVVDLNKAIKWDREFLDKYAINEQIPFYKEKIATLQKLLSQEQAFRAYQAIQFAHLEDEALVVRFTEFLKQYPDFQYKDKIESDMAYAYARMDERKKSAQAFQAIASSSKAKLSSADQAEYEAESRYSFMRWGGAVIAWSVIGVLWIAILWMRPWRQLDRRFVRKFLLWPILWLVITAASIPVFLSLEVEGYPVVVPATTVYLAAGLNLVVLLWIMLMLKAPIWQGRPRTMRWLTPVLALAMTCSVFYLWVAYQDNGPWIVDLSIVKYKYWQGEWREWASGRRGQGHSIDKNVKQDQNTPQKSGKGDGDDD